MSRLLIVCGRSGAGKTTYSIGLSEELVAIRFSIDSWMHTLFAKDMTSLDFLWMMERVERCQEQIWDVASQILTKDGNVVLDLGFTTRAQRALFIDKAMCLGVSAEVHFLDAPLATRKQRVARRNAEKDPSVNAFEVTDQMFTFIELQF